MDLLPFGSAVTLALVHLLAGKVHSLRVIPRSSWLSAAGGASVAYVFLHLLPELSAGQELLTRELSGLGLFLENHIYLVALGGLALFYGLERMARGSRRQAGDRQEAQTSSAVYRLHILAFILYNMLVGYLLVQSEERDTREKLLFTTAMALHFLVNDVALDEHHKEAYRRSGRWLLAGAILVGWGTGVLVHLPEVGVALLLAFLAGGIILNVLKEELPEERESRFSAFFLGAAGYAALLLLG